MENTNEMKIFLTADLRMRGWQELRRQLSAHS